MKPLMKDKYAALISLSFVSQSFKMLWELRFSAIGWIIRMKM